MKHTKGEWKVDYTKANDLENAVLRIGIGEDIDGGVAVLLANVLVDENDLEQSEYNAKLIAAAPELLEQLEKAKNTLISCISELPESYKEAVRIEIDNYKKAIKKATK